MSLVLGIAKGFCHTPKPGLRRKCPGAGDVIQVSQHIHSIVQQALTFNKKGKYITCLKRSKYRLTTTQKIFKI